MPCHGAHVGTFLLGLEIQGGDVHVKSCLVTGAAVGLRVLGGSVIVDDTNITDNAMVCDLCVTLGSNLVEFHPPLFL